MTNNDSTNGNGTTPSPADWLRPKACVERQRAWDRAFREVYQKMRRKPRWDAEAHSRRLPMDVYLGGESGQAAVGRIGLLLQVENAKEPGEWDALIKDMFDKLQRSAYRREVYLDRRILLNMLLWDGKALHKLHDLPLQRTWPRERHNKMDRMELVDDEVDAESVLERAGAFFKRSNGDLFLFGFRSKPLLDRKEAGLLDSVREVNRVLHKRVMFYLKMEHSDDEMRRVQIREVFQKGSVRWPVLDWTAPEPDVQ